MLIQFVDGGKCWTVISSKCVESPSPHLDIEIERLEQRRSTAGLHSGSF